MNRDLFVNKIINSKKIVIKIGSSVFLREKTFLNNFLFDLIGDLKRLYEQKKKFILVSSGSVAQGKKNIDLQYYQDIEKQNIAVKQALASLGQNRLMNLYDRFFSNTNIKIAQILLGIWDLKTEKGFFNLKNTFSQLLDWNVLPIVNENDSTTVRELNFGDNDLLSAMVSLLTEAEILIILTNVDGYSKNKKLVSYMSEVSSEDYNHSRGPSEHGIGGMITKLKSSEILNKMGRITIIANFNEKNILEKIFNGQRIGTLIGNLNYPFVNEEIKMKQIFEKYILGNI